MKVAHKCRSLGKRYLKSCHCPRHLWFSLEMNSVVQKFLRTILVLMSGFLGTVFHFFSSILGLFSAFGASSAFSDTWRCFSYPPSPSPPRIYAFISLHMYSWNKQPVGTFCRRCCRRARKLTSVFNGSGCLGFPLKLKSLEP